MTLKELLEYLDGRGIVFESEDLVRKELAEIGLDLDHISYVE